MINIYTLREVEYPEVTAIEAFLKWQNTPFEKKVMPSKTLVSTLGKSPYVIYFKDKIIGYNFFEIIDFFKKNNLVLC